MAPSRVSAEDIGWSLTPLEAPYPLTVKAQEELSRRIDLKAADTADTLQGFFDPTATVRAGPLRRGWEVAIMKSGRRIIVEVYGGGWGGL